MRAPGLFTACPLPSWTGDTLITLQRHRGDIDPLVFVQRQLGHSSIQTTMVYLHLINELADSAVLAYDDELNDNLEKA